MRKPLLRLSFAIAAVAAGYLAVSLDPPTSCNLSAGALVALVLLPLAGVSLVLAIVGFLLDVDDGPLAPLP